jgi:hypothetical protein
MARERPGLPIWLPLVRIAVGLLLLADAALEYQPGTYQVFVGIVYSNASVSPEPLRAIMVLAAQTISRNPAVANGVLAGVETLVGVAIAVGSFAEPALVVAIPLFLLVWVFGQGLGLPFAGGTTDLNSGPAYTLLILILWRTGSWRRLSVWAWVQGAPGGTTRRRTEVLGAGVVVAAVAAMTAISITQQLRSPGMAGPPAVGGAVLVSDGLRNQDLLFGGCNLLTCSNATWLWNGRGWTRSGGPSVPPPLGYAGGAYDAGSGGVVIVGGAGSQGLGPARRSTWSWDGAWRSLSPGALTGRRFPAVAYDPRTGQLLLFGGDTAEGRALGDTFLWSGTGWRRLSLAASPPARTAAALAYDPQLGELILYGGSNGSARLQDTWAWTGVRWKRMATSSAPGPLAYSAMATDPTLGTVVLYAGAGAPHRTWALEGRRWVAIGGHGGPPVYSFEAMAAAPSSRGVLLFGGGTSSGAGFSAATWLFSGGRWQKVAG